MRLCAGDNSGKRRGKVARELAEKGYCSTKSLYDYDVKLHLLGERHVGTLPVLHGIVVTPASENDLNVLRQNWSSLRCRIFFVNKAYINSFKDEQMYYRSRDIYSS